MPLSELLFGSPVQNIGSSDGHCSSFGSAVRSEAGHLDEWFFFAVRGGLQFGLPVVRFGQFRMHVGCWCMSERMCCEWITIMGMHRKGVVFHICFFFHVFVWRWKCGSLFFDAVVVVVFCICVFCIILSSIGLFMFVVWENVFIL